MGMHFHNVHFTWPNKQLYLLKNYVTRLESHALMPPGRHCFSRTLHLNSDGDKFVFGAVLKMPKSNEKKIHTYRGPTWK